MRLLTVLRNKKYFALAVTAALVMFIAFPLIQVQATGGFQNIDVWFAAIPILNLTFVAIFALLFGVFLSFQIYNLRNKVCSIGEKTKGAASGGFAAILGILVPACPVCLSIVTLLLPAAAGISVAGFLTKYGVYLLAASSVITILGIYLLGGFKRG